MSRLFDDASNQYLNNALAAVTAPPFTMGCWFYADVDTAALSMMCIGTVGTTNHQWTLIAAGTTAGDPLQFLVRTTANTIVATTTGFTANTWHHAIAVEASSTDHRVYIDGGSEGSSTTSRVVSGVDETLIGARLSATQTGHFSGRIAEAGVWNVALNADERAALARGVPPDRVRPSALAGNGYWPLFGVGSPEPDYSGGGFHMTLNAAPTQADHARVAPAFGVLGDWLGAFTAGGAPPGDPEGPLVGGKLIRSGILVKGRLVP